MADQDDVAGYHDVLTGRRDKPRQGGDARVAASAAPEAKSLLGVVVATLVVAALYFGRDVLVPITLAIMLSFVLSPVVNLLQRLRLWRAPAVILAVLAALGVLGLIGTLIGSQAAALAGDAPRYAQTIEQKVQGVQGYRRVAPRLADARASPDTSRRKQLRRARRTCNGPAAQANGPAPGARAGGGQRNRRPSPLTIAKTILQPDHGSALETTVIVLIVDDLRADAEGRSARPLHSRVRIDRPPPHHDARWTMRGSRLSRYFLSQLAVNTGFGIVIGHRACGLIGIPSPAMWGILAGIAALRAVYRIVPGRGRTGGAGRGDRSGLGDGDLRLGTFLHRRAAGRLRRRALALRPLDRAFRRYR